MHENNLLFGVESRRLRVVVVGAGYAGLPVALALAQAGFVTTALDSDASRVAALSAGRSYLADVPERALAAAVAAKRLSATGDAGVLERADAAIVCVPTPLNKTRDPDIRHVLDAVESIARHQHEGMLVVLESTSYPGTTRELVVPRLTGERFRLGESVFVAFSPERIDPGNVKFALRNTPKVIAGACPASLRVASALYATIVDRLVPVSSTDAAETVKLLENTFRAVNVALVNELALSARELGVDVFEVVEAAASKPFGFMPFFPGPGLGGHCVPVDPLYLSWRLRSLERRARLIDLADSVNLGMPEHVAARVAEALNSRARPLRGSRVLVYGVAYKRDVADTRESPAVALLELLAAGGAEVAYSDPWVPRLQTPALALESVPPEASYAPWDAVVVATDHELLDRARLLREAVLIVDPRGALRALPGERRHVHGL